MHLKFESGRLTDVVFHASPNHSKRSSQVELVVIHCISLPQGEYNNDNVEKLFLNSLNSRHHKSFLGLKKLNVSSHIYIKRTGEILQFVPFNRVAWHAGVSSFNGRENCNEFSIGIELQGSVDQSFEEAQYKALNEILKILKSSFPLKAIVGHSDIAPTRKTDPGPWFDWEKIIKI